MLMQNKILFHDLNKINIYLQTIVENYEENMFEKIHIGTF